MTKPLLSVCLITYNQAKYIREAVDSILSQQINFPWELVIADDFSTDGTREILQEYKKSHPELIKLILQKKNVGAERNWHDLINYPKSKYIAYLEGDDYWTDSHKLQTQVDYLEKHKEYALCFHPAKIFFENGEEKQSVWPNLQNNKNITINELISENFIPSNSVVYRRQNYKKLPYGIMPGDWFFHLYHAQFGEIGVINKVMSSYRRHSGGLWWDAFQDKDLLWKKYGLAYANFYIELLKIFGKDAEKQNIIYHGLSTALANLVAVDKRFKEKTLSSALERFPQAVEPFIISQHSEIQQQQEQITNLNSSVTDLNRTILDLRAQVFRLRDELHMLRGSRVIGRIIKAREYVGVQTPRIKRLHRTLPRRASSHLSRFLPEASKVQLRRVRHAAANTLHRSRQENIRYEVVRKRKLEKSQPLVSVIIPYYNRADTIDDTLNSLDVQTFRNFETIIVNDGSPDELSVEKLMKIKKEYPHINIIHQENQGVAAARNKGMSLAKGFYLICLDSDDILEATFIEKCTAMLETNPDIALATTYMEVFGVLNEEFKHVPYNALELYGNNMVITAAEFRREAWEQSGGYKSNIGYEDWEFWLTLAEHGFWGKTLPEPLFKYRTSMQSRYVEDKDIHWNNIKIIRSFHQNYKKVIRKLRAQRKSSKQVIEAGEAFINMDNPVDFAPFDPLKKNILITVPWMTFGGAETLIYNYCREIKDKFNLSFVTGLNSDHEWEYKFREVTPYIYHLTNLFEDEKQYLEFVSNYIKTRQIEVLHIIHNGFTFAMLPILKERHPKLKVIVTMFNDRVAYFDQSVEYKNYINIFTSDNVKVTNHFLADTHSSDNTMVIPNGINCYDEFNPKLFDRSERRQELGIEDDDIAVMFVGRLSEEKNPNIFLDVANRVLSENKRKNVKFFIIGDGPMRGNVEKQIKDIHNKNVTYLGYQSEVARYFSAADIFILPSSIEGFPLSILEAMAMKVAVIASDVGAVAEVLENGVDGFVVPPASVIDIKRALELLCDDQQKLNSVKTKAREKVKQKYSNRLLGSNYQKLYSEAGK